MRLHLVPKSAVFYNCQIIKPVKEKKTQKNENTLCEKIKLLEYHQLIFPFNNLPIIFYLSFLKKASLFVKHLYYVWCSSSYKECVKNISLKPIYKLNICNSIHGSME